MTYGPGLVGALLVGVAEAKAIAFAANKPLVGVHHIEGHISANYIENKELEPPFLCLVVSGGHSHLVRVKDYGEYEILGKQGMTQPEKPLIKLRAQSDLDILAGPKSIAYQTKAIRRQLYFRVPKSQITYMISASAA